jgi:TolB protein
MAPTVAAASPPLAITYQLTHTLNYAAAPSPDGSQFASITVLGGKGQIFILTSDGLHSKQITHDEIDYDDPQWSPDGTRILVTGVSETAERIYLINADGGGLAPITPPDVRAIHAVWFADGKRIAYCADDDQLPKADNNAIYTIDVGTHRVTTLIDGGINTYPSISPDMKRVTWRKVIADHNSEIFVADIDGSNAHNISNNASFDGWPAWSPDGKNIAFASNRTGNYQVFMMKPDGSDVRLVANSEGRATAPRWSADSKTIYFTNCRHLDYGYDCDVFAARV